MSSEVETSLNISDSSGRQQPRIQSHIVARLKCSQATKCLSCPNNAPGSGKSGPDWHYSQPSLFGVNRRANVAHDRRNAHLQDQARSAGAVFEDIRTEGPA